MFRPGILPGLVERISILVELPRKLTGRYRPAILRAAEQCTGSYFFVS